MSVEGQGTFTGSGVIGRYWQARSSGFEVRSVRGRRLGRVERLELDRATRIAVAFLVRRRFRRALRVRPECISAVDPWRRLLVVALPRRQRKPVVPAGAAGRVGRRAAAAGPPLARAVVRATRSVLLGAVVGVWLYSFVAFTLVRLGARVLLAVGSAVLRGGAIVAPRAARSASRGVFHGVK